MNWIDIVESQKEIQIIKTLEKSKNTRLLDHNFNQLNKFINNPALQFRVVMLLVRQDNLPNILIRNLITLYKSKNKEEIKKGIFNILRKNLN